MKKILILSLTLMTLSSALFATTIKNDSHDGRPWAGAYYAYFNTSFYNSTNSTVQIGLIDARKDGIIGFGGSKSLSQKITISPQSTYRTNITWKLNPAYKGDKNVAGFTLNGLTSGNSDKFFLGFLATVDHVDKYGIPTYAHLLNYNENIYKYGDYSIRTNNIRNIEIFYKTPR